MRLALLHLAVAGAAGLLPPCTFEDDGTFCGATTSGEGVGLLQTQSKKQLSQKHDEAAPMSLQEAKAAARRRGRQEPVWDVWPAAPPSTEGLWTDIGPEGLVPADPTNDVAARCSPGDDTGRWYFNVTKPQLYAFPADRSSPLFRNAAVMIFPGGGFQFLAWNKEGTDIAEWLNSIGYTAFVLKYRIPGDKFNQAIVHDAQRAMSLIRSKADDYALDPAKIGVLGFSAGGALVTMVAGSDHREYQPIDEVDTFPHKPNFAMYVYGAGLPWYASASPPVFMAIAHDDPCVPEPLEELFYQALKESNVPVEMHNYESGAHGYGRCTMYTTSGHWEPVCGWPAHAQLWLDTLLMAA